MVLMRILLSPVANGHEFWSNERRIPVSSKNTRFSGSICLIVSQYSTLNFWTLSVAAWLLYHVFFYDLILTSAWADTLPWSSPNFQSDEQIIHTTLPALASGCSATSALTNGSAFVRWLNCGFPLCFGCKLPSVFWRFTSFWTRLLLTPNLVATFLAWHLLCQMSLHYFLPDIERIRFPTVWLQQWYFSVPHNSGNRCTSTGIQ